MARSWPHLRALLIVVHLFAVTALAFPAPGSGLRRSAWSDPTVQDEFAAWELRLAGWGVHFDDGGFEDALWAFASGYQEGLNAVLAPFRPYYRYCGTQQSWRMFVAPHRYPAVLHIEILDGRTWRPVYIENSAEHTWHGEQLDHDRVRSALFRYSWSSYRSYYNRFTGFLARDAAVDFPHVNQVRFRYYKYKTLTPQQVRDGEHIEGSFIQARTIDLRGLR